VAPGLRTPPEEHKFNALRSHGGSQLSRTPVLMALAPSSGTLWYCMHTVHKHADKTLKTSKHIKVKQILKKKKNSSTKTTKLKKKEGWWNGSVV